MLKSFDSFVGLLIDTREGCDFADCVICGCKNLLDLLRKMPTNNSKDKGT